MRRRLININEKSAEIVPDDFQHTTCKDAGSAENAGAIFSRSIHGGNIINNEELKIWENLSH
jgi:hypothetical protein